MVVIRLGLSSAPLHGNTRETLMRLILLILLLLPVAACSNPLLFGSEADGIVLRNRATHPLLYLAVEREVCTRLDPNPSWRVADHLDHLIEPGETRRIEVDAYQRGDDVCIFLYRVTDRSGTVPLVKSLTVTHAELRRSNYLVVVETL